MKHGPRAILSALVLAGLPLMTAESAHAHSYHVGAIQIGHLWAKPVGHDAFQVYGPVFNNGAAADRLVGVHSLGDGMAYFGKTVNGKEQPVLQIALPPGQPVSLAAWTVHIDLDHLKRAYPKGRMIPLVLDFAHAGSVHVAALVEDSPSE